MSNNYHFVLNQYKHFNVYYELVDVIFDLTKDDKTKII